MLARRTLAAAALGTALPGVAAALRLQVGPDKPFRRIADAAHAATPGTTIEVDAGDYPGDGALIDQDGVSLRAVGGVVDLQAAGRHIEGKATIVVRAQKVLVEGFRFREVRVPDGNGAGIRFDRGSLTVRACAFFDSQAGLLAGNDRASSLRVEHCEFARNGTGDGYTHQLYAGLLRELEVTACWFHQGIGGQHIKSRAAHSRVLYNRITDGARGRASYELEFPNGGRALALGNLIQQSPTTENRSLVSYGAEGYPWPENELLLVHNTLHDARRFGGRFLHVWPGPVRVQALNNLLVGGYGGLAAPGLQAAGNQRARVEQLADPSDGDYRLRAADTTAAARWVASLLPPELTPRNEYRHPCALAPLPGGLRRVGAMHTAAPNR